jgi:[ribosomal protein S18]-alanine N-acetyltransferase
LNKDLRRKSNPLTTKESLIRDCEAGDLHAVQGIEKASFDDPYSPMIFWALYLGSNRIFRVSTLGKKVIGYSIVKVETKSGQVLAHLISLAVDPATRMKGVGSKLLEDAISQTKESFPKCKGMELEVRIDNKQAVALYLKYGFRKTQTISNYYGRGKDALAMELDYESNGSRTGASFL